MSYIENLLGSPVIPEVQESLGLAAGNYKIKGFDLYASGDLVILDEGLALVDGLRIVSSANLKLPKSSVLSKYVFLRIYTYTEIIDGLHIRNADLSLIAQASSTPVNDTNLYDNATGTKDVLLAYVNDSGVVDLTTNGTLGVYDIPTRLTSVETKNTEQDTRLTTLDADTGWVAPTMVTGYTYTGNGVRKIGNVVYFDIGTFSKLNLTAIPSNTVIATLPIQFRTSTYYKINCVTFDDETCYLQINADGRIYVNAVGTVFGVYGVFVPPISYLI